MYFLVEDERKANYIFNKNYFENTNILLIFPFSETFRGHSPPCATAAVKNHCLCLLIQIFSIKML